MKFDDAKHVWPKRMPIGQFSKRWYTSRCRQSVINDIKSGALPGGNDGAGRSWYVWVNSDFTPAHGYNAMTLEPEPSGQAPQLSEKARQIFNRAIGV